MIFLRPSLTQQWVKIMSYKGSSTIRPKKNKNVLIPFLELFILPVCLCEHSRLAFFFLCSSFSNLRIFHFSSVSSCTKLWKNNAGSYLNKCLCECEPWSLIFFFVSSCSYTFFSFINKAHVFTMSFFASRLLLLLFLFLHKYITYEYISVSCKIREIETFKRWNLLI